MEPALFYTECLLKHSSQKRTCYEKRLDTPSHCRCRGLYFRATSRLPIQATALWGYIDPLSEMFMAALFLGERLTPL